MSTKPAFYFYLALDSSSLFLWYMGDVEAYRWPCLCKQGCNSGSGGGAWLMPWFLPQSLNRDAASGILFSLLIPEKGRKWEGYCMNGAGRPRTFSYPAIGAMLPAAPLKADNDGSEQLWGRAQVASHPTEMFSEPYSKTDKQTSKREATRRPRSKSLSRKRDFKCLWEFLLLLQLTILFTYRFSP